MHRLRRKSQSLDPGTHLRLRGRDIPPPLKSVTILLVIGNIFILWSGSIRLAECGSGWLNGFLRRRVSWCSSWEPANPEQSRRWATRERKTWSKNLPSKDKWDVLQLFVQWRALLPGDLQIKTCDRSTLSLTKIAQRKKLTKEHYKATHITNTNFW